MLRKFGTKGLVLLAVAALVAVAGAIFAAVDLLWLAVAGLGVLQVAVLGLLLAVRSSVTKPMSALRDVDTLTERLMAAVETERLDAADRHQQLLDAVRHRDGAPT